MEENRELIREQGTTDMQDWMRRMEEASQKQVEYAKKQCIWSMVRGVCSGCVLLAVIICAIVFIPKITATVRQIGTVMEEMETVVTNLEVVSRDLAQADMTGMLDGVNRLVQDSQKGVEEAMGKISAVDIDTLNIAINDFKQVVEPLAKLFRR